MGDRRANGPRKQTNQYRCVKCGFQTSAAMFELKNTDRGRPLTICPDCGSDEVVDADTLYPLNR